MMRPKSRTWIRSHVPMTNDMSCSTSRTASPDPATSRSNAPIVDVSVSFRPADGSSSSKTRGWVASARPSSTRRAVPVGSRSTRSSATACSPTRSRISSATTPGARERSCAHPRRISAATRTFSRAVRLPKVSSRWNVRPIPSRARWCGLRRVMSRPSSSMRPVSGACSPVTTLNRVVLPAPLGPMRPVTCPTWTSIDTSLSAWRPPKLTDTCCTSRSAMSGRCPPAHPLLGRVARLHRRRHGRLGRGCDGTGGNAGTAAGAALPGDALTHLGHERPAGVGAPGQERGEREPELDGRAVGSERHVDREQPRAESLQGVQPRRLERGVEDENYADPDERAAEDTDGGTPRRAGPELREEDDGHREPDDDADKRKPAGAEVLLQEDEPDIGEAADQRTTHGLDTAHDDEQHDRDGQGAQQREVLRGRRPALHAEERPGKTGHRRRQRVHRELGTEPVHAEGRAGRLTVAERDEPPPVPAAPKPYDENCHHTEDGCHQQQEGALVSEP